MAVFTFSIGPGGAIRALDLLGISREDKEAAVRRLRVVFGEDFNPVNLTASGSDAPSSLKIDSSGYLSDRFGNTVAPQDFLSGAITRSGATDFRATDEPPVVADPEAGGIAGGPDIVGTPLSQADPQSGRFAAYLRELGNRGFTSGLGRQLQERRFAPAQSAFFGEEALGQLTDPNRTAGTFEQFLRGAPAGLGGFGSRARTAFGNLANLTGPSTPFGGDLLSQYTNPDFVESRIGDNLSDLALAAARANVAPIVGNQLFRSDRFSHLNLRSQFQAQTGTGGSGNFIDFLKGRFGL